MSDIQSDRSVLPSPAEVRLKKPPHNYRNLVKKAYHALRTAPERFHSTAEGNRKPLTASADPVILRVSKIYQFEGLETPLGRECLSL